MAEQEYFKKALSNFTYHIACGGAIRHMADQGYSVKQIIKQLDFPTSYEKVQHMVWEHLQQTGILLSEEPGSEKQSQTTTFVKEYDKYGKPSFRRVVLSNNIPSICWKETEFYEKTDDRLAAYLNNKYQQNHSDNAYISFDFGIRMQYHIDSFTKALQKLTEYQKDYILGRPWEKKIFYHKINCDIIEIASQLYELEEYNGCCYFIELKEKINIRRKHYE